MKTVTVLSQVVIFIFVGEGGVCYDFYSSILLQICQILRLPWSWFMFTEGEDFLTLIDSLES